MSNDDLNALAAEYVLGTLDYEERKGANALLEVDPTFRGIVRIWEKRFGELHLMVESVAPDAKLWERIRPKVAGVEQVPPAIPSHAAESSVAAVVPELEAPAVSSVPDPEEMPAVEVKSGATAEAEQHLAQLAALLPVAAAEQVTPAPEPAPESPLARTPETIKRGFVPPPPMIRRSTPAAEAAPVRKSGRGWMAASLMTGVLAVVLAGLIGAWRYFPERLPAQLRADVLLNLHQPEQPSAPPQPRLPPFAE